MTVVNIPAQHIGKAVYSTTNSTLMYPITELNWERGILTVIDLDTDEEMEFMPGEDQASTEKIFKVLGFEIGDYSDD